MWVISYAMARLTACARHEYKELHSNLYTDRSYADIQCRHPMLFRGGWDSASRVTAKILPPRSGGHTDVILRICISLLYFMHTHLTIWSIINPFPRPRHTNSGKGLTIHHVLSTGIMFYCHKGIALCSSQPQFTGFWFKLNGRHCQAAEAFEWPPSLV